MPIEADPVRREVVAASSVELSGTLSPRTKPPRQGQSVAVPGLCRGGKWARRDRLSKAARQLTQILQPRRMIIFTISVFLGYDKSGWPDPSTLDSDTGGDFNGTAFPKSVGISATRREHRALGCNPRTLEE